MTKKARVQLFLRQLVSAEPCASEPEAYALIEKTLNAVEDEHSGVPFDPSAWASDGRLYMPQADNSSWPRQYRDVVKYRSVGHATFIAVNGAFLIQEIDGGRVLLDKPGQDGRRITDFRLPGN